MSNNSTLKYVHQDSLSGTALVTDDDGDLLASTKYYPYGYCRNSTGDLGTDKLFTGQRLDDTGLYYYGARYYDPLIGRFISPDSVVPSIMNPQSLNRYSYCLNNPLKYTDPTGRWPNWGQIFNSVKSTVSSVVNTVTSSVSSAVSTASSYTSSWYSSASSYASSTWSSFSNKASTVVTQVSNTASSIQSTVTQAVQQAKTEVTTAALGAAGITNITSTTINIPAVSSSPIQAPVIEVAPGGLTDKVVLKSGIVDAVAMSVPGIAIVTTSTDPTIIKHESYHFAEQRAQGALSWTANYLTEIGVRGAIYSSLNVNNAWDNAYYFSHDEQQARGYARQPIGDAPGPGWIRRLLGD